MSRRRRKHEPRQEFFHIFCTDRGSHGPVELVYFFDNRFGETDEEHRQRYHPSQQEAPSVPERERLRIHQIVLSGGRHRPGKVGGTTRRSLVELTLPDGRRKTRLMCPRCGRDEQFSEKRLARLADALRERGGSRGTSAFDMSRLGEYLDNQ